MPAQEIVSTSPKTLPDAASRQFDLTSRQLQLIKRTYAADCSDDEFNLFIEAARHYGLSPFKRQIIPIVFSKGDEARRRLAIIVTQDGQRIIANRTGTYRPASEPIHFVTDDRLKDEAINPAGLLLARTQLMLFSHGGWHPVIGEARWSEFAPIRMAADDYEWVETDEVWADTGRKKKRKKPIGELKPRLEEGSPWQRMPFLMLGKCSEVQALRRGWPDEFGGLYTEEEAARPLALDLDASEAVERQVAEDRQRRIGAAGQIAFTFGDLWGLEHVDHGKVFDRVVEWLEAPGRTREELGAFLSANRHGLQEFWAMHADDALELKKRFQAAEQTLAAAAAREGKPA